MIGESVVAIVAVAAILVLVQAWMEMESLIRMTGNGGGEERDIIPGPGGKQYPTLGTGVGMSTVIVVEWQARKEGRKDSVTAMARSIRLRSCIMLSLDNVRWNGACLLRYSQDGMVQR